MSKREKNLEKARSNPGGLTFRELLRLARAFGFDVRKGGGSHRVLVHDELKRPIPVQSANGAAKPYQVRQFIEALRELGLIDE